MTDERIFGEDRNGEPGLTPMPEMAVPPQFIEIQAESAAAHSPTRSWVPMVTLRLATDDGSGLVGMIEVGDDLNKILNDIRTCAIRAVEDLNVSLERGDLPL